MDNFPDSGAGLKPDGAKRLAKEGVGAGRFLDLCLPGFFALPRPALANCTRPRTGSAFPPHTQPSDFLKQLIPSICSKNRQTLRNARQYCETRYQNRKNLWISRPIRRPETRMKATHRATANPAQASRIAPQPSRPRLSDFRLPGFQTARRGHAREIWIQNFDEKTGKPAAAPFNAAKHAIKTGEICG